MASLSSRLSKLLIMSKVFLCDYCSKIAKPSETKSINNEWVRVKVERLYMQAHNPTMLEFCSFACLNSSAKEGKLV